MLETQIEKYNAKIQKILDEKTVMEKILNEQSFNAPKTPNMILNEELLKAQKEGKKELDVTIDLNLPTAEEVQRRRLFQTEAMKRIDELEREYWNNFTTNATPYFFGNIVCKLIDADGMRYFHLLITLQRV